VRKYLDLNLKGNYYYMSQFMNKNTHQISNPNANQKTSQNTKHNIYQTSKCASSICQVTVLIYNLSAKLPIILIQSWKHSNDLSPIFFSFTIWGNLLRMRPLSVSSLPKRLNTASLIRHRQSGSKLPTRIDLANHQDISMMNDVDKNVWRNERNEPTKLYPIGDRHYAGDGPEAVVDATTLRRAPPQSGAVWGIPSARHDRAAEGEAVARGRRAVGTDIIAVFYINTGANQPATVKDKCFYYTFTIANLNNEIILGFLSLLILTLLSNPTVGAQYPTAWNSLTLFTDL
jgi:hypothetical protein